MNPLLGKRVLFANSLSLEMLVIGIRLLMLVALLGVKEPEFASEQTYPVEQRRSACELFGTVYVDNNPYRADYRVFVEEDEYSADVIVFKEDNELMADKTGLWFFTPMPNFAEFTICYVKNRSEAHFTIYFTDIDVEARCNR